MKWVKLIDDFMPSLFVQWRLRNLQMIPSPELDTETTPNQASTRSRGNKRCREKRKRQNRRNFNQYLTAGESEVWQNVVQPATTSNKNL